VSEIWLSGHAQPSHPVDVTDYVDRKFDALLSHVSQHPDPDGVPARITEWMTRTASALGLPDGRLAEAFRVVQAG
jgi:hypothetical protein